MNREEQLDYLINYLIDERDELIDIPENYQDKRKKIAKKAVAVYIIRLSIHTHTTFFLSYLRSFFHEKQLV